MKLQGLSRAKASAWTVLAGRIANGMAKAQRRETPPLLRARCLGDQGDTPSCDMGRKERSSMSTKSDFTPEEWETLRNAPYLAAAAVMMGGRSGISWFNQGSLGHSANLLRKRIERESINPSLERPR